MPYKDIADQQAASRRHYLANRQKMIDRAKAFSKKRREDVRAMLQDLKSSTPCTDCKLLYPYYVMHFDHVRGPKLFNIALHGTLSISMKRVLAEIEKCEIVCANCHAARTFRRGQHPT